jgi:CheY-like chemotaxis protein
MESQVPRDRRSILIIDDDPASESIAVAFLALGFEVRSVRNGYDAQVAVQSFRPSLILINLGVCGMPPLELARRLKGAPFTHRIPVIAVTAPHQEVCEDAARAAGCAAYFEMPIDPRTLPEAVSPLLLSS